MFLEWRADMLVKRKYRTEEARKRITKLREDSDTEFVARTAKLKEKKANERSNAPSPGNLSEGFKAGLESREAEPIPNRIDVSEADTLGLERE
jgi:hypothetical protein